MKRKDIMDLIPETTEEIEGFTENLKDFIDYVEGKFNAIRDLLDGEINIADVEDKINDAFSIADELSDDLY